MDKKSLYRKTYQELNLSDDFLFAKVMEDEEILKSVIEKILGIKIRSLQITQPQAKPFLMKSSTSTPPISTAISPTPNSS